MWMYQLLGVDEQVIQVWRSVHEMWQLSGTYTKALQQGMRLTG